MTQALELLEWRDSPTGIAPFFIRGKTEIPVVWAPQPGSAVAFLSCPVLECLIEGTRGGGKSDDLLMDFAQHVGQGWGQAWRGILFRRTYKELADIIAKSLKWFPRIWPKAQYNSSEHYWSWPDGETLFLRYFAHPRDYWGYHGHEYPWIGWEELTNWHSPECYKSMFACNRSTAVGIPRKVRATCNPYGVGHNWVKSRWRLPISMGRVIGPVIRDSRDRDGNLEPERVAIHSQLSENKILLRAQPNYVANLRAAARNASELKAWLYGDWNIVAGGMFDDVYNPERHVLPNFPLILIPRGWFVDRSYDHGQTAPFSVGWWAESNGEPLVHQRQKYGTVRGDIIRIAEWYGWNGQPNEGVKMTGEEIARGIIEREADWGLRGRVRPGAADTQIFDDYEPNKSAAGDMARLGVLWERADKSPGSRKKGWEQLRKYLKAAAETPREAPGLFLLDRCEQFKRTVPVLPRSDRDLDDVDDQAEDHVGDESRYRIRCRRRGADSGTM